MTENLQDPSGIEFETAAEAAVPTPGDNSPGENSKDRSIEARLQQCQAVLQYSFSDPAMLKQALTHASISLTRLASNERMEFLGDAIMGAIVCEELFRQFPDYAEGELTRIKSSVVSRHTCTKVSNELDFGRFVFLGKGLAVHERIPSSILAALFESIIAAIYLDGGWEPAQRFVLRALSGEIDRAARTSHGQNFKSQFQQLAQKDSGATPVYRLLDEKGPDHSKCFEVAASIGSKEFPSAWGASKKEAEQNAAQKALEQLESDV
jgi:ribonuclease III